jgi:hypothetical protein
MWLESEGWEHVWVGRDDVWPGGQRERAGQGVDLEVARRAGVFVGNGVGLFFVYEFVKAEIAKVEEGCWRLLGGVECAGRDREGESPACSAS